jgi:hypothetical protein
MSMCIALAMHISPALLPTTANEDPRGGDDIPVDDLLPIQSLKTRSLEGQASRGKSNNIINAF